MVRSVLPAILMCACVAGLALGWATPAQATRVHFVATGGDERPGDPQIATDRVAFDCNIALQTLTVAAGFADTLSGDTTGATTLLPSYACIGWDESGPEHVYRLQVSEAVTFWAILRDMGANDLDLFLLTECNTDACAAHANTELAVGLDPGTYFLVVDGYQGAAGSYTLDMSARAAGLPDAVCDPDGDTIPIASDGDNVVLDYQGNLNDQPNYVDAYWCSPVVQRSGEEWFAVTLPDSGELHADLTAVASSLDVSLWLFDDCGPAPTCIDFVDERGAGQEESLDYTNETGAEATVYLAVDAFRAPDSDFGGAYTLGGSLVPTQRATWTRLRNLYR